MSELRARVDEMIRNAYDNGFEVFEEMNDGELASDILDKSNILGEDPVDIDATLKRVTEVVADLRHERKWMW